MEVKSLSLEEIRYLVLKKAEEYPSVAIRKVLRDLKLPQIRSKTIELVRYCLALEDLGFPITSHTACFIDRGEVTKEKVVVVLTRLHNLGDKHVLTLLRKDGNNLRWIVSPLFRKKLEEIKRGVES